MMPLCAFQATTKEHQTVDLAPIHIALKSATALSVLIYSLIASMTTSKPQYETYRLSGVPAGVPAEDIRMCFPESDRQAILHISRAPFDQQRSAYVFTITFSRRPESLANLLPTSDTARLGGFLPDPADRLSTVTIDAHFSGLTQLNDVQGGEDVVE